jgi:FOG: Ankyrin repeat
MFQVISLLLTSRKLLRRWLSTGLAIWVILCFCEVLAVTTPTERHRGSGSVQLTARIVEQKYCNGDGDIDQVWLRLILTFTNRGTTNLFLYKGARYVDQCNVSLSLEDAAAGKYVLSPSFTHMTAGPVLRMDEQAFDTQFTLLTPGASYQIETEAIIFAEGQDSDNSTGALKPSQYFLQVHVNNWPLQGLSEEAVEKRLGEVAVIWHESLTSEPFQVSIDEKRHVEACSPYRQLLEAAEVNPNVRGEGGFTALLLTVTYPDFERFLKLLNVGADPNARTNESVTPLMIAATRDSIFVKELTRRGADVNASASDGGTPLMNAVSAGLIKNVRILINAGANVNAHNKSGQTPLMLSEQLKDVKRRSAITKLLRSAGARMPKHFRPVDGGQQHDQPDDRERRLHL